MATKAQLEAQIAALLAATDTGGTPARTDTVPVMMRSLGFVVIGTGTAPEEGTVLECPKQGGGVKRIRALADVTDSVSQYGIDHEGWAFTYQPVKRGNNG